jgi:hypothetical protein
VAATNETDILSPEALRHLADERLYVAKTRGRNCVEPAPAPGALASAPPTSSPDTLESSPDTLVTPDTRMSAPEQQRDDDDQ